MAAKLGSIHVPRMVLPGQRVVVPYFEKLRAASGVRDSLLCVGLDPDPRLIPGGLNRTLKKSGHVIAYKLPSW